MIAFCVPAGVFLVNKEHKKGVWARWREESYCYTNRSISLLSPYDLYPASKRLKRSPRFCALYYRVLDRG